MKYHFIHERGDYPILAVEEIGSVWVNLIVPSNGTIGNQIFRAIVYLGKGKGLAAPSIFKGTGMYEDDSRNERDWYPHLIAASAWAAEK